MLHRVEGSAVRSTVHRVAIPGLRGLAAPCMAGAEGNTPVLQSCALRRTLRRLSFPLSLSQRTSDKDVASSLSGGAGPLCAIIRTVRGGEHP